MAIKKHIKWVPGGNDSQILESRGKTGNNKRDQGEGTCPGNMQEILGRSEDVLSLEGGIRYLWDGKPPFKNQ